MNNEKTISNEDLRLAIKYYNVASMHLQQQNLEQSTVYYHKALEELNTLGVENHKFNVILNESLGDVYTLLKSYENAAIHYSDALQIGVNVYGESTECVNISIKLSDTLQRMELFNEAFSCLCKTYEVLENIHGEGSEEANKIMDKLYTLRDKTTF
ncbi:MAG: tetratricopeptide repeat protein [Rikenellaceae bacterium]